MKEFVISEVKAETAVLVGLITKTQDEAKTKEYLDELEFLADTAALTATNVARDVHFCAWLCEGEVARTQTNLCVRTEKLACECQQYLL